MHNPCPSQVKSKLFFLGGEGQSVQASWHVCVHSAGRKGGILHFCNEEVIKAIQNHLLSEGGTCRQVGLLGWDADQQWHSHKIILVMPPLLFLQNLSAGTVHGSHGSPNNASPFSNMRVSTKHEINIGSLQSTFFYHVKYSEKMKTRRFTYATHELALKILIPIKCKNNISSGDSTFDLISTDIQWWICGLGRKRFL